MATWPLCQKKHPTTVHRARSQILSACGITGLPRGLSGKELPANAGVTGDVGSIPGSGRFPGGGNGNLLQYSCLENPMDRGAWWAVVHRVAKSQTQLSMHACTALLSTMYLYLMFPRDPSPVQRTHYLSLNPPEFLHWKWRYISFQRRAAK